MVKISDYTLELNATDTEGNIKLLDDLGNQTVWDESGMKFFNANSLTIPFWYNKKVAFGTAEDGEYVDLSTGGSWDRPPNVHVAISNFPVYLKNYNGNGQVLNVGAENISVNGFNVIAKLEGIIGQRLHDYVPDIILESTVYVSRYERTPPTNENCTRMIVKGDTYKSGDLAEVALYLEKENADGTWTNPTGSDYIYYKSSYSSWNENFEVDTGILTPSRYRIKLFQHSYSDTHSWIRCSESIESYGVVGEIATGEVSWIAVENS